MREKRGNCIKSYCTKGTLSLRETTILKGVAILFMLYLHLFSNMSNVEQCITYLSIDGVPLVYYFSRCTGPVPFFLILSGYGLYISHQSKKRNYKEKVLKLYMHYWISMLIFVTLGYFLVDSTKYPGSWWNIVLNMTGWQTTYNGEIWFLFPYMLLFITSPLVFRFFSNKGFGYIFISTALLNLLASVLISRYGVAYLYAHRWAYFPVLYMQFLFPFMLGAILVKYDIIARCKTKIGGKSLILLVLLVAVRMSMNSSVLHALYSLAFIILFAQLKRPAWLDVSLHEMGRRSTSMWFVHSYFCYYLFGDFIYGFKYPMLIFAALISVSYVTAVIIDWINRPIQRYI